MFQEQQHRDKLGTGTFFQAEPQWNIIQMEDLMMAAGRQVPGAWGRKRKVQNNEPLEVVEIKKGERILNLRNFPGKAITRIWS